MYRVLASFCGNVNGQKDQLINISDPDLAKDLKKAGYIEEYKEKTDKELKASVKALEEENAKQKEELDKLIEEKKQLEDEITSLKSTVQNDDSESGLSDDNSESNSLETDKDNTDESQKEKVSK